MITQHGVEGVFAEIARLHDHKGTLEVSWIEDLDKEIALTSGQIWELSGEPAENVRHEVDWASAPEPAPSAPT
jgi:hypothetical protein